MEAIKAHILELGLDLDATDDLLEAYEETAEEDLMEHEDMEGTFKEGRR